MRAIWIIIICISAIILSWYVFIRPYEFEVKFKARTLPGDLISTIRIWDRTLDNAEIIKVDSFNSLTQTFTWNNKKYIYTWNFEIINDSTTSVKIEITEPGRSVKNKLLIPFTTQPIEQDAQKVANDFYEILTSHLEKTKVTIVGEESLDPLYCVCSSLKTEQTQKAFGMMKDYNLLVSFITSNNLIANGPPVVKIKNWNHSLGMLEFDFCFPIQKSDKIVENEELTFKDLGSQKVLKAVYNGNYITSDRAWYSLIEFAKSNGYEFNGFPIEYFHNNPNLGMKEIEWKAEVFLPIK